MYIHTRDRVPIPRMFQIKSDRAFVAELIEMMDSDVYAYVLAYNENYAQIQRGLV